MMMKVTKLARMVMIAMRLKTECRVSWRMYISMESNLLVRGMVSQLTVKDSLMRMIESGK